MIELKDFDPSAPYLAQLQGPDDGQPVTLINTFLAPEGEIDKVIDVWREDSFIMKGAAWIHLCAAVPRYRGQSRPDERGRLGDPYVPQGRLLT